MSTITKLMENKLDGRISSDELNSLRGQLNSNWDLRKEYLLRKELNELAAEDEYDRLRHMLMQAHERTRQANGSKKATAKKLVYAAATLAGITIAGWAAFQHSGGVINPIDLYKENLFPYPPIHLVREAHQNELSDQLMRSLQYYRNANYLQASTEFESLLKKNPNSVTIKFYLGISYLYLDKVDVSRGLLLDVAYGESLFADQALWYLGLGYLAEGNVSEASLVFEKIANSGGSLGQRAAGMVKKLKVN